MLRIEPRLRQVVVKACKNSYPATKVLSLFEDFCLLFFSEGDTWCFAEDWWKDILLEEPTCSSQKDNTRKADFKFHVESSSAGFHRLLLHAVAQFHGLTVVSKLKCIPEREDKIRSLTARGLICTHEHRLLTYLQH